MSLLKPVSLFSQCPTLLQNLFQNDSSKFWMPFLHNHLHKFTKAIWRMERESASALEVADELTTTKK
jgi:hypothetical protein